MSLRPWELFYSPQVVGQQSDLFLLWLKIE